MKGLSTSGSTVSYFDSTCPKWAASRRRQFCTVPLARAFRAKLVHAAAGTVRGRGALRSPSGSRSQRTGVEVNHSTSRSRMIAPPAA